MTEKFSVDYEGYLATEDLFHREAPASLEGNPRAWELIRDIVDHGCYILTHTNDVRDGREIRDLVTAALLRRTLIFGEGIRTLIGKGLEEPATVLFRTLLELEVNLRLVTQDEGDEMAHRLAAFHYLDARRHFDGALSNPDTRGRIQANDEHWEWTRETSRRMREFFESDTFQQVRTDVKEDQYWHGFPNIRAAFKAADMLDDYLTLFDTFSSFSHGGNVDFDFVGFEEGDPQLKALPQRDPARNLNLLHGTGLKLVDIYIAYLQDRGNPEYQPHFTAKTDTGHKFPISAVDVLVCELATVFDTDE